MALFAVLVYSSLPSHTAERSLVAVMSRSDTDENEVIHQALALCEKNSRSLAKDF